MYNKYNGGIEPTKNETIQNNSNISLEARDANLLQAQITKLKQDLKRKDERLGRVVEHDTLIQNKCDSLTREVAYLKQCLVIGL